ncbi:hypothetical protein [Rubrolithibacter danxiaensis]
MVYLKATASTSPFDVRALQRCTDSAGRKVLRNSNASIKGRQIALR